MSENIRVMVRCRPLNEREKKEGAKECISFDEANPNYVYIGSKTDSKKYVFDYVGGANTTQDDIFRIAGKPLALATLEGYNSCIFAYGQTGAGKTFTMQGRGLEKDGIDSQLRGLQPRVFDFIFGLTNKEIKDGNGQIEYLISCSYLEIYNEQIIDLLSHTNTNLMVREDLKKGVYIEGLLEEQVNNSEDTIDLLRRGMRNRHVGATNMNADSSRSHSVFSMTIESKKSRDGMSNVTSSKLHFVDLAGSERQKQTAAAGDRLKEATNINKSLTTLGLVINSLVESANGKARHIPYRDSKLTFLLKDSLGGNSRTYMIAAVSVASTSFQETLSTLKFAQRAKMIKNKASINEEANGNLESLKKEIKRLKDEIVTYKKQIEDFETKKQEDENQMEEENNAIKLNNQQDNIVTQELQQSVSQMNQKYIYLESYFKDQIETLRDSQLDIQTELEKKNFYLQSYHSAQQVYDNNEYQYRSIIFLYEDRIRRYFSYQNYINKQMLAESQNEVQRIQDQISYQVQQFINDDYKDLYAQYQHLLQVVSQQENIMAITAENVQLKELLEKYEGEANPTSTFAIAQNLNNSISALNEVSSKLNENLEERKNLDVQIDRANFLKLPTPEKVMKFEEQLSHIKIEHNKEYEKLNYEILTLKQRELAQEKQVELQRKKYKDVQEENVKLKEKHLRECEEYEKRIEETLQNFEKMESQKTQSLTEHDKIVQNMKYRILELENQNTKLNSQVKEVKGDLNNSQITFKKAQQEQESQIQEYEEKMQEIQKRNSQLESHIKAIEQNEEIIKNDLETARKEINEMNQKNEDLANYNLSLKQNIEQIQEEKKHLKETIDKIQTQTEQQNLVLQSKMDAENEEILKIESEKNKIQEQLETLTETFNFQQEELEENRNQLQDLQDLNAMYQNQIDELKKKNEDMIKEQSELKETLLEKNGELSNNIAAKENNKLIEANHELKMQLEAESKSNISLRSQLNQMNQKISDLSQSEEHFRSAYLDIRNQLQGLVQKNKDLQQALSTKEMEQFELQRDMKSSNENVYFLQERIVQLKDENKLLKTQTLKVDDSTKNYKEKVTLLQQSLTVKMDELQQMITKKSALETQLSIMQKEIEDLKIQKQNSSLINDRRVHEIMQTYSNQYKENKDLQKTLNSKIQENLALTANVKILQNLVQKYQTKDVEDNQDYIKKYQNAENEKQQLIERLDEQIEKAINLETEIVRQMHQANQNSVSINPEKEKKLKDKIESLKQQLQEKEAKEKATQQQINNIAQQIDSYKNREEQQKNELNKEIEQLKQIVKQKSDVVKILEAQKKSLQQQLQESQNKQEQPQQESPKNLEEMKKLKEQISKLEKEKNDSRLKIADLNKRLMQNENINTENYGGDFFQTEICSLASRTKEQLQSINRAITRNLPQFQENDFPENFAFLSPAFEKMIEVIKDKDKKISNLAKDIDQQNIQVSKLMKEKQAISKKYGLSQMQINGLMTPNPKMRSQMEQQQQQQQIQQLNNSSNSIQSNFQAPMGSCFKQTPSAIKQQQLTFQKQMQHLQQQKLTAQKDDQNQQSYGQQNNNFKFQQKNNNFLNQLNINQFNPDMQQFQQQSQKASKSKNIPQNLQELDLSSIKKKQKF